MNDVKLWFKRTITLLIPTIIISFVNCLLIISSWAELVITGQIQMFLVPLCVLGAINFVFALGLIFTIGMTTFKFLQIKN